MSCTRRGFLTTLGAALAGLGLVGLEPLRAFARSPNGGGDPIVGGPPFGPFSADALRARAVETALALDDVALADFLEKVCCWAPAAAEIRKRPPSVQYKGARHLFAPFPNGAELAEIAWLILNTSWSSPALSYDVEEQVQEHYQRSGRPALPVQVTTAAGATAAAGSSALSLVLDRNTGERLEKTDERSEPMWAAISMLSGAMLDPAEELNQRLARNLSLRRAGNRILARTAAVTYTQIVLGAAQRALWADHLGGANAALPLVRLTAAGFLPVGEPNGTFQLIRVGGDAYVPSQEPGTPSPAPQPESADPVPQPGSETAPENKTGPFQIERRTKN